MESLRIKHVLLYLFRSEGWFAKMLILFALLFLPFIGWLAIGGYFLRITRNWINERYEGLPDFSDFGELIVSGLILMVVFIIYGIPQMILAFIPCLGNLLATAYNIIIVLISPYIIAAIATQRTFSGKLFDFNAITKFVQDNIVNLLILLGITFAIGIALMVILVPLVAAGIILISIAQENNVSYLPAIAVFILSFIIAIFAGFWYNSVSYALSGNIFGIWQRSKTMSSMGFPTTQPPSGKPSELP